MYLSEGICTGIIKSATPRTPTPNPANSQLLMPGNDTQESSKSTTRPRTPASRMTPRSWNYGTIITYNASITVAVAIEQLTTMADRCIIDKDQGTKKLEDVDRRGTDEQHGSSNSETGEKTPALLKQLARAIPKVELHVPLEGTLEPDLVFSLAKRNNIDLSPYFKNEDDLRSRYNNFTDLNSFLNVYYQCASVLCTERDFYDLTMSYFSRAHRDKVVYAEMFFDPQHHKKSLSFETCADGVCSAMHDAQNRYGITSKLIPCFLRHLSEESAISTWIEMFKYFKSHPESKSHIVGVGLDSSEKKHPPRDFHGLFWMIRHASEAVVGDIHIVAHAGEEGPARYITEALNILHAERIDHGVRCADDKNLVQRLRDERIPLTVCPLSNIRLKVFGHMKDHNLKQLLGLGLNVSIHSDDPAYFGYMNDNYCAIIDALDIDEHDILNLAMNAINSAFLTESEKDRLRQRLYEDSGPILDKLMETQAANE